MPAVGNLAFCLFVCFVLFLVEVAVPGSPSLIVLMVSVDVKQYLTTELSSCVKAEVAVLGSPSLIILNMIQNTEYRIFIVYE